MSPPYDTTAGKTIHVPRTLISSTSAGASATSFDVSDAPGLVVSGFGVFFAALPTDSTVLVDVQLWIENDSGSEEEFFIALTKSKTNLATGNHTRQVVWKGAPNTGALVQYRAVLTLSGSNEIGLAIDTKDAESNTFVYYGGDHPAIMMTAQVL